MHPAPGPRSRHPRPGARCTSGTLVGALVVALGLLVPVAGAAGAEDPPPTNEVPTQDIVPKPDSGAPPDEAGDRGGALQLLLPALIVAAVGGGGWHLSRQAKAAQATGERPPAR